MKFLFITTSLPQRGCGAGERSASICRALARHGEVRVMSLRFPWSLDDPRGADYSIDAIPEGRSERSYWRQRNYLMGQYRVDERLALAVSRIHRTESFSGFMGYGFETTNCGSHRFGPSSVAIDQLPTELPARAIPGFRYVRRKFLDHSLRRQHAVFVTKQSDVRKLKHQNVHVLPCISTQPSSSGNGAPVSGRPVILFVGAEGHVPNQEGLHRFVRSCLPQIRAQVPAVVLRIVGVGWQSLANIEGVELCGYVPDLTAEYHGADLAICPIWSGCGSCVKLAEAIQFGTAVVASPYAAIGYEGLLQPDRDLLVADSDDDFARACIRILTDEGQRRLLESSAETTARSHLSQQAIDRTIDVALGIQGPG